MTHSHIQASEEKSALLVNETWCKANFAIEPSMGDARAKATAAETV
jgi:hypothetical protein